MAAAIILKFRRGELQMSLRHQVVTEPTPREMTTLTSDTPDNFLTNEFLLNASKSRLQALYSDFSRQKQSNPTSFHANVDWWRRVLKALVHSDNQHISRKKESSRIALQADHDLLERLKVEKIGKPLAMGAILVRIVLSYCSIFSISQSLASPINPQKCWI